MKSRNLKIGLISMHVVASWGKKLPDELKKVLPEGTVILKQWEELKRASLAVLIYNEDFPEVADGKEVPFSLLDIGLNDEPEKPKLVFNY